MADEEENEPPPPPVFITVYMGAIPPPKPPKKKKAPIVFAPPEPEEPKEEGEEGGDEPPAEGADPVDPPPEPEAEEPKEPEEPPPPPEPRSVRLNCNVPILILLHQARKCFLRDEPEAAAAAGLSLASPPTVFDLATIEGKVADLAGKAEEGGVRERAGDKVEARGEYVLVLRTPGEEEGQWKYVPLCTKFADLECAV